jgi:hypothetical protein
VLDLGLGLHKDTDSRAAVDLAVDIAGQGSKVVVDMAAQGSMVVDIVGQVVDMAALGSMVAADIAVQGSMGLADMAAQGSTLVVDMALEDSRVEGHDRSVEPETLVALVGHMLRIPTVGWMDKMLNQG